MSNDALILDLSTDLPPVRRRSVARESTLLLGLCSAELGILLALGLMRPDMGVVIGSSYMIWKLGSLAVLATVSCAIAMRSFSPAAPLYGGLMSVAGLSLAAILIGTVIIGQPPASGEQLLARLSPGHGIVCAISIIVLSLPIIALLGWLMRRGAPTHVRRSARASGIAAGSCAALVFAVCCRMNDPLYIVVWYGVGCGAAMSMARWLLPARFRL